jgi:hypothetical protein
LAESSTHAALIQIIIDYIGQSYAHKTALGILHDLPSALGAEKPRRIEGYVPDVYAFDAPLTMVIIGEAKTAADLETAHSRKQMTAYLAYLGQQSAGVFILAVPWQVKRLAKTIVSSLCQETGATTVTIVTLDDLGL